jgi:hypothetical protein
MYTLFNGIISVTNPPLNLRSIKQNANKYKKQSIQQCAV